MKIFNIELLLIKKKKRQNQGNWGSVPCLEWSVSCQNDLYYAMIGLGLLLLITVNIHVGECPEKKTNRGIELTVVVYYILNC